MLVRELREAPDSWAEHWRSIRSKKTVPFHAIDWIFQWLAYYLSHWAFLEVLEYLGALSVLFGVIFYYSESGDRRKQRHYQAWQVVNSALGQHGSGGRIEALQELNADRSAADGCRRIRSISAGNPIAQSTFVASGSRSCRHARQQSDRQ